MHVSPLDRKPWRPGHFVTARGLLLTPHHLIQVSEACERDAVKVTTAAIQRMMQA
jgi:hypothetical protein